VLVWYEPMILLRRSTV